MKLPEHERLQGGSGYFLPNLLQFSRLLRQLDIPVSTQQVYEFAEGVTFIDLSKRDDFYHTSRAFFLHDIRKIDLYNIAFDLFWANHLKMMLELSTGRTQTRSAEIDADPEGNTSTQGKMGGSIQYLREGEDLQFLGSPEMELKPVFSPIEVLDQKDFRNLSSVELQDIKEIVKDITINLGMKRSRRKILAKKKTSHLDFRRSIRKNLASGGEVVLLEWHRRKLKVRPLVLICDMSGSMESYATIFLYFMHAMVERLNRLETFAFGTRLTRLTPAFKSRKFEDVLENLSDRVNDWSGGTRIGESIREFNYHWSKRVLRHSAVVIIISDGWDRGNLRLLEKEIARLKRSSSQLIWLNPLADSPDYQPLVGGIKTVMPYVDLFHPFNNLKNLKEFAGKLSNMA
ncbi:MAG: VWA domain-containing protein [Chloroflexota bacterium]|nr:MAG: VWA domain-containing protein [Chloroflexota bacterium]